MLVVAQIVEYMYVLTEVHGNQNIRNSNMDNFLKLNHIPTAGIDALAKDGCMDGTRVKVLEGLRSCSRDPDASRVYWLVGPAGAGKSAIARSFARFLRAGNLLGGSSFCHRPTASRADARRILPTLANFLARRDSEYCSALEGALEDPQLLDIGASTVDLQFEKLLVNLLGRSSGNHQGGRLILVIDALDECGNAVEVDRLLTKLLGVSSVLPLKFFITSRPERHIRDKFEARTSGVDQRRIIRLHEIEHNIVADDIALYLRQQLNAICKEILDVNKTIPAGWSSEQQIDILARQAGTLFIYAATAAKYIKNEDPAKRLQNLVDSTSVAGKTLTSGIDEMYEFILSDAMDHEERDADEISLTKRILAAVIAANDPF
ncbi:hypothetical protein HGRIS_001603 [Hohenbuehelia grisea]|uniref:NACHT domain-containing protein n=1 Tax=Hohenbuehelia grisea TaxID=104357 RepID=A0ABR3JHZ5_9AGAR